MRMINETSSETALVRMHRDEHSMAGVVVVKSTYAIHQGHCALSRRQHAVLEAPTTVAGATFESETVLGKIGVDLLIVGAALAPESGARMMAVGAAFGPWTRQLLVFGDRVWQRRMWRWTPSDPATFEFMPMTWGNAFGGVARCQGNPLVHPGNPQGKGYVVDVDDEVVDAPLPNIEDPDDLLELPTQSVEPVGFAPLPATSALRINPALDERKAVGVNKSIFNVAAPANRVEALHSDERCELWGWAGLQGESFGLPTERFVVELRIDARKHELWPQIDTLCVFPATRELVLTYRVAFTYSYPRNAPRVARIRHAEAAQAWGGAHALG